MKTIPMITPDDPGVVGVRCPNCGADPAPGSVLCLGCQDAAVARVRRTIHHRQQRQIRLDRARVIFDTEIAPMVKLTPDARDLIVGVMADLFRLQGEDLV